MFHWQLIPVAANWSKGQDLIASVDRLKTFSAGAWRHGWARIPGIRFFSSLCLHSQMEFRKNRFFSDDSNSSTQTSKKKKKNCHRGLMTRKKPQSPRSGSHRLKQSSSVPGTWAALGRCVCSTNQQDNRPHNTAVVQTLIFTAFCRGRKTLDHQSINKAINGC